MEDLHDQHFGMCMKKSLANSYLWWPGLDKEMEPIVRQCTTCQSVSKMPPSLPLQSWEWTARVWQRLHVDFAELEGQQLFIIIDSHSKWVEVFPWQKTTPKQILDILHTSFSSYGFPEVIVSNN